jgi:hypothetical protein
VARQILQLVTRLFTQIAKLVAAMPYGPSVGARLGFASRTPLPIGSMIVHEAGVAITPNKI